MNRLSAALVMFLMLTTGAPAHATQRIPGPAAPGPTDTVTLLNGDKLSGRVTSMDAGGRVSFLPYASGEPLVIGWDSLDTIRFGKTRGRYEKGEDTVLLTNGDRITGELLKFDEHELQLRSPYAELVTLPANMVKAIVLAPRLEPPEAEATDRVTLANGDEVRGTLLSIEGGEVRLSTQYGLLPLRKNTISAIVLNKDSCETPARKNQDAKLLFHNGDRITAAVESLDESQLRVNLLRSTLVVDRSFVEFLSANVYGRGELDAVASLSETTSELRKLVTDLGDDEFRVREDAAGALLELGYKAEPALEIAARSKDVETRMRAREILDEIHWHIEPKLKDSVGPLFANYRKGNPEERRKLIDEIISKASEESIPLLLNIIEHDDADNVREHTYGRLRGFKSWEKILKAAEGRHLHGLWGLRTLAHCYQKKPYENRERLAETYRKILAIEPQDDQSALSLSAIYFKRNDYAPALELLEKRVKESPGDARFLYVLAACYGGMGKKEDQARLEKEAQILQSESGTLYRDATFLLENDFLDYSACLWKKMLDTPPRSDVYDANAHLRLGGIYESKKQYDAAEEHYRKGIAIVDAGQDYALTGGTLEQLRQKLRDMKWQNLTENGLDFTITFLFKPDHGEYAKLRNKVKPEHVMGMNVKPDGLRIIEEAKATVRYNAEKHTLVPYLGDSQCGDHFSIKFPEGQDEIMILMHQLDMSYFYRVRRSGECNLIKKFERDYLITGQLEPILQRLKELTVIYNKQEYGIEDITKKGIKIDWFPEELVLEVKGTAKDGTTLQGNATLHRNSIPNY